MKIFATGDTHGNFERFRPEYFPEGLELTKEDVVLQLGDFGLWGSGKGNHAAFMFHSITPYINPIQGADWAL